MDLAGQAAGIGALADPTRRALYVYVTSQDEAVGREEVSTAAGVPLHSVSFHLDKMVAEGLLDVEFRRLTGRTGPGAGRPSKLYRRSARQFTVSLPPRRYDVVGEILADAVAASAGGKVPIEQALSDTAAATGHAVAAEAQHLPAAPLDALSYVLAAQGFEPRHLGTTLEFGTCPFDRLANRHTALICGLNRQFVQGVADGLGQGVEARLEPGSGGCCVRAYAPSPAAEAAVDE